MRTANTMPKSIFFPPFLLMMKSLFRVSKPIRCGLVWCGLNPINTGPESDLLAGSPGDSFVLFPLWLVQGQGWWLIRSVLIHTLWSECYQPHLAHLDHQLLQLTSLRRRYMEHIWAARKHNDIFGASHFPCLQLWGKTNLHLVLVYSLQILSPQATTELNPAEHMC